MFLRGTISKFGTVGKMSKVEPIIVLKNCVYVALSVNSLQIDYISSRVIEFQGPLKN